MMITKGCSQCQSETDHCDECSEHIRLEISHTPPNHGGEIVIDFEYTNSKGETVAVSVHVPPQRAGRYVVELDCVAAHVSWFAPLGSRPARVTIEVRM